MISQAEMQILTPLWVVWTIMVALAIVLVRDEWAGRWRPIALGILSVFAVSLFVMLCIALWCDLNS